MLSNHLILCHPLLLLPSIFPASVFSSELALCIRQPKYWSFSFDISPSNIYSGLISFRIHWFDLQSKGLSRVFSSTTTQQHQFFFKGYKLPVIRWINSWDIHVVAISSVQFSHSVVSNSLQPHELQHAPPPCPSPTPGVNANPSPLSRWCHPTISSSVVPFSYPQSFPASGSFPVSQLFASGCQSIGVSASASALPMNTQDWSPLGWTGWIPLQSKGLSKVFSNTTVQKH